ncbi:MAG: NAD(P)H-hydrate dehydratase [Sandaracinaceae bacterium]
MRPLLTRASARAFDRAAMNAGIPGLILMENAGRGAADCLEAHFAGRLDRVVVVGGTGQNGGDAWVVARRLCTRGRQPTVFLLGDEKDVSGDAATELRALRAVGCDVEAVSGKGAADVIGVALTKATALVEGVFGTGLDRAIEGWRAQVIRRMAASDVPMLALDLPAGIDADTGAILGEALPAEITVTFAGAKRGLLQGPGRAHAGDVVVVDIGVPPPSSPDGWIELSEAARILPSRATDAHKGSAGHVIVVAGSPGTSGAALLASRAVLRGGAGLVTLASRARLDGRVVEVMARELGTEALSDALSWAEGKSAAVVGPGLGTDADGAALARGLSLSLPIPAVLDADALTAFAGDLEALREAAAPRVLTPHPGEAGRMLGISSAEVQADRYRAAAALSARSGQVVVLKGAGTIVASNGKLGVCTRGTPALGVAGTGDVLAGAIGATLASGADPHDAATAAVVLHAVAGEQAAQGDRGLLASEVADALPAALQAARAAARR